MIPLPRPLNDPDIDIISQFIDILREYYRQPGKNEYSPTHLWETYKLYFNFLRLFADPRITQVTKLQWHAEEIHIKEAESIDWRTRRGGKSIMLSRFAVFFSLIQFGKYEGQVIYRCPFADQLTQFKFWLKKNPFIRKVSGKPPIGYVYESLSINMNNYGKSTSASAGGSVFLADEGKKIPIGSALQDYYIEARGMFIEDEPNHKRIIHASTGGDHTQFALDLVRIRKKEDLTNTELVIRMPWTLCPWITQAAIDEEMELNLDSPYYVDQEYNCINVPHAGYFFNQDRMKILGKEVPLDYFSSRRLTANTAGLDWNGSIVGHIIYEGYWDGNNLYLMAEHTFSLVSEVHDWINAHPEIHTEVESKPKTGGFNAGFSDHLMSLDTQCSYIGWDERGVKDRRLALLQRAEIFVHPSCHWFIRNYKEASFDPKSLVPKLKKTATQHGLDCALHMLDTAPMLDVVGESTQRYAQGNFSNAIDMMRYGRH